MVMGYCILGGIVFEHLEKENELQVHNTGKMQVKNVTLNPGARTPWPPAEMLYLYFIVIFYSST